MLRKSMFLLGLVSCLLLADRARATSIAAPPPGPLRYLHAEAIVVGRVIAIENKDLEVQLYPGSKQKEKVRIALVKVNEPIKGVKANELIRVSFNLPKPPPQPVANPQGGLVIRPLLPQIPIVTLSVGQEGLFTLTKHHDGKFYMPPGMFQFTSTEANDYKQQQTWARQAVKLLENPQAGLTSKDPEERLNTAALLVGEFHYLDANMRTKGFKKVPIDAKLNGMILDVLKKANWNTKFNYGEPHPYQVFMQLGVTAQDGYTPPRRVRRLEEHYTHAQAWLNKNAKNFRIQKYVPNDAP